MYGEVAIRAIIALTPDNAFNLDDRNFLAVNGITTEWMFEYVLAKWPYFEEWARIGRYDLIHNEVAVDTMDAFFADRDPAYEWVHRQISEIFDRVCKITDQLIESLRPHLRVIGDGTPDQPVEYMTFERLNPTRMDRPNAPAVASVISVFLEAPMPKDPPSFFKVHPELGWLL